MIAATSPTMLLTRGTAWFSKCSASINTHTVIGQHQSEFKLLADRGKPSLQLSQQPEVPSALLAAELDFLGRHFLTAPPLQ
mmetsp:Transcript_82513/g.143389  ORF Transcript_82513/g.143389 Transcript_82513/m.143389 type:complete len:81 (-) Transcript_82513:2776-3018(-)